MNELEFNSLLSLTERFPDEKSCREYLEQQRWNGIPICPHCDNNKVYRYKDGRLFKCAKCKKQFTVRVGTIFEDSPLSLRKWFMAIYLITAHKKGISSLQLSKDIGITQKSAWHMLHRIRYAMQTKSFNAPLSNVVEADETYIGGKNRFKHKNKRTSGTGMVGKQAVFGMLERKGNVRAMHIQNADAKTLVPIILLNVDRNATIMTDEFGGYYNLDLFYKHGVISHTKRQYVKGDIHTQTIDNFWSLLKRGILGIYHQVSPKHLHRYISEFEYRYNKRKDNDPIKFNSALGRVQGRLQYKDLIKE